MQLVFKPWRRLVAVKDPHAIRQYLGDVATTAERIFKTMKKYPPASTPGEYPAIRTGRLRKSITRTVTATQAEVGSNMFYSIYLREGTKKMARRKMSDNALKEARAQARLRMKPFVRFRHGG